MVTWFLEMLEQRQQKKENQDICSRDQKQLGVRYIIESFLPFVKPLSLRLDFKVHLQLL